MALPSRLFCDTSFFYACLDPTDSNHDRAAELTADAATSATSFFTRWDIVSETITLLRYRRGFRVALTFLEEVKPNLIIVEYGPRVRTEAEQVFRQEISFSSGDRKGWIKDVGIQRLFGSRRV